MATAAIPTPETAEAPAPKKGGPMLIIVGAVAGLALGWVVGSIVIAPKLAAGPDAPAEVVALDEHGKPLPADGPGSVHSIENLVVNPAGTNGQRFLLITTAIVVKDASALEEVAARDAEVRDRVVELLSSRTVEALSDPTKRETLKNDLAAAVGALFEEGVVKRVLLPQFVIQ